MKKNILSVLLLLVGMNVMAQSVYDGKREAIRKGSGTQDDPFLIENAQNLAWLQYLVNMDYSHETAEKYYLLTTDIDLNGSEVFQWEPIGKGDGRQLFDDKKLMFKGNIDGGYHKITNLYINQEEGTSAFFEDISGIVKNLYIEGYVYGNKASGLVGNMEDKHAKIELCVVNVDVEGNNVAGVVNKVNEGVISKIANLGDIRGNNAGGIAYYSKVVIENSYNRGTVETNSLDGYAGGITAALFSAGGVLNCYNAGDIKGMNDVYSGGIIGHGAGGSVVENNYYLNTSISNSNEYGIAMNADDMRNVEFVNTLNTDGIVWAMDTENVNDGYPVFADEHLGITETSEENEVVIYPNPASEYVNFSDEVLSCEVYDILGNKVFCSNTNSSRLERIDVSNWNTGVYFVRIKLKKGFLVVNKLIVK